MKKILTTIATILAAAFFSSMFLNARGARTYAGDKDDVAHSIQKASKTTGIRQLFQEKSGPSPFRHQISEASAGEIYENAHDYNTQSRPSWTPITGNAHNMISYGHVYNDGVLINGAGYYLVSFGPAGEEDCRSASEVSSDGFYYATIKGDTNGEAIHFKIYETGTDETYYIKETLSFQADDVKADLDLNLTARTTVTISGKVTSGGGKGLQDVTIAFSNGGGSASTGADGSYSHTLNPGWSGTATSSLQHCIFTPSSRSYSNVFSDMLNQDYKVVKLIKQ